MPTFESPIGSRKFANQSMREFEVPDDTDSPLNQRVSQHMPQKINIDESELRNFQNRIAQDSSFQEERELMAAQDARRTGKEKISEGAKKRIEMLLGMTYTTKEVNIDGNIFILKSLKSKDMREALIVTAEYDGTVQAPYEMRRQLLGRSITHVAGVEIEQFIGSNNLNSKLSFLDELDESLLSRLYDEYVLLTKIVKDKYSVKTETDVKEVVEDIKKS